MNPLSTRRRTFEVFRDLAATAVLCWAGLPGSAVVAQESPDNAAETAAVEEQMENEEAVKELIKELSRSRSAKGGNQFCAVIVGSDGQLAASPEANELSSVSYGGRAGQADVVASNSSYTLSVDVPLGFSLAPPGANDSLVMKASYSGFGATGFSATPGNIPIRLNQGSTTVLVNLVATKLTSLFPAGQYRAEIVLRCE